MVIDMQTPLKLPSPQAILPSPSRAAFTLVELAIVLVIIGLLIGGVLGGQTLIRSSELQSVMSDLTKFKAATTQFKDQYGSIAGDLPDATSYWNSAGGTGVITDATCRSAIATTQNTCNGDGDGTVFGTMEGYLAWQHLAKSGLIVGSFSGAAGPGGVSDSIPGTNVPAARISGVGYSIIYMGVVTATNWGLFQGDYGSALISIGSGTGSGTNALTPGESYQIDLKIDDGKPGAGDLSTNIGGSLPTCPNTLDATQGANAQYALTNKAIACRLFYKL
jgi:prepilin-type N-terminal cleavage/methylation domain-containing protein